jgi:polyhydroxyalkanoate synthesis regulator phasin
MTAQHKNAMQDLTNQFKEAKHALEEQKQLTRREKEQQEMLQATLGESRTTSEELRAKITELENSRPNPGKSFLTLL